MQTIGPQAETDALAMLAAVLQANNAYLYSHADELLTKEQIEKLESYLHRYLQHEPTAYILQQQEFFDLEFFVTTDVLIPRASTECLVEFVLQNFTTKQLKVLELGTGSGCISCTLAYHNPEWNITAIDISATALKVANKNAEDLQCKNIQFLQSDWFNNINHAQQYDLIISNPPYIAADDPCFNEESLAYEPQGALISANNGLADIENIIHDAKQYLSTTGNLILEHGNDQADAIAIILKQHGYKNIINHFDLSQHPRFTSCNL